MDALTLSQIYIYIIPPVIVAAICYTASTFSRMRLSLARQETLALQTQESIERLRSDFADNTTRLGKLENRVTALETIIERDK